MEQTSLITIFLTGLLTGGLTCMAVQGGLLAATIAQRQEEKLKANLAHSGEVFPIVSFLIAKLVAYTILGFFLGWLGSFFQLSITTQVILQIAVSIFMIGTALNILHAHPIFRYFVIQPPKFLTRIIRNQTKSTDIFAPAILGAFTIFIPCGTTQAMMALTIASGNSILGSAILFTFVLGTSPIFFILSYIATRVSAIMQHRFMKLASLAIIALALFNINTAIKLSGSPVSAETIWNEIYCTALTFCSQKNNDVLSAYVELKPVQEETITINNVGYTPSNFTVKAGSEVKLHLKNAGGGGCAQAFTIPKLGLQKVVTPGNTADISFTAPNEPGQLAFMCSMGMYRGTINVVKT